MREDDITCEVKYGMQYKNDNFQVSNDQNIIRNDETFEHKLIESILKYHWFDKKGDR